MTDTRTQKMLTKDAHVICALVSHSMHCRRGFYQPNRPARIQSANTLRSDLDTVRGVRGKQNAQRAKHCRRAEPKATSLYSNPSMFSNKTWFNKAIENISEAIYRVSMATHKSLKQWKKWCKVASVWRSALVQTELFAYMIHDCTVRADWESALMNWMWKYECSLPEQNSRHDASELWEDARGVAVKLFWTVVKLHILGFEQPLSDRVDAIVLIVFVQIYSFIQICIVWCRQKCLGITVMISQRGKNPYKNKIL